MYSLWYVLKDSHVHYLDIFFELNKKTSNTEEGWCVIIEKTCVKKITQLSIQIGSKRPSTWKDLKIVERFPFWWCSFNLKMFVELKSSPTVNLCIFYLFYLKSMLSNYFAIDLFICNLVNVRVFQFSN